MTRPGRLPWGLPRWLPVMTTGLLVAVGSALPPAAKAQHGPDDAELQRVRLLERIDTVRRVGRSADVAELLPLLHDEDRRIRGRAESAIWSLWSRTGNARLDRLYRNGVAQLDQRRLAESIRTFSRLIDERPGFAEAWNKRATARYLAGDYAGALADGLAVLDRVPDHFGTLAAVGHAYYRLEQPDRAIAYWRRALVVNPNLDAVRRSLEAIERRRPGAKPRIVV